MFFTSSVDPTYGPIGTTSQNLWTFSQELLKLASVSRSRRIILDFPAIVMDILGDLMWDMPVAALVARLTEQVGRVDRCQ